MKITLPNEQIIVQEALQILSQHMPPSQLVVLISRYWLGSGDYFKQREELFADESLDSLVDKIQAYEAQNPL